MTLARISLAVLLLLMALGQAVSFGDFTAAIDTYQVTAGAGALLAVALIAAEAVGGAALLAPAGSPTRRHGGTVTAAVAIVWAALAAQAFARGLVVPNCGCFGRFASQELRWWVLLEDVYFVAAAVWVAMAVRRAGPEPGTVVPAAAEAAR